MKTHNNWKLTTLTLVMILAITIGVWGLWGNTAQAVNPPVVSVEDLQSAVIISEYLGLANVQRDAWNVILLSASDGGVDIKNEAIRDQALGIWGVGTETRSNLDGLFR